MLIDTHAHLDYSQYEPEFDEILAQAHENDVEKIIIPGVEPSSFAKIVELAEKHPMLYAAVGIHPSEIKNFDTDCYKKIYEFAQHPKVVAIGEIGLDYHYDKDKEVIAQQKKAFEQQLEIALLLNKPVIVHSRDSHHDTFDILKRTQASKVGVVMHCFSGSVEFAFECTREGWYIGLGGVVTFKNALKPKDVAASVPLESILLETDAPYLAPEPFRGQTNYPKYVKLVAKQIAYLKDLSYNEVAKVTSANARKLFKI